MRVVLLGLFFLVDFSLLPFFLLSFLLFLSFHGVRFDDFVLNLFSVAVVTYNLNVDERHVRSM